MPKQSKRRLKKQQTPLTGPVLIQYGLQAFKQANYDEAISLWKQAGSLGNDSPKLSAPLAEAYFRRALTKYVPDPAELQQTTQLNPADPRYHYHLALAYHRLGLVAKAEPLYRQLLVKPDSAKRAAIPLALLLIEQKKSPTKDPVWNHLGQNDKTWLTVAEALSCKKATANLFNDSLDSIWQGLLATALGNQATAQQKLQSALKSSTQLQALLHYYLGVLAAADNQTEQAMEQWQAAWANGLDTPHLRQNLSALLYKKAMAKRQAGRLDEALALLESVNDLESLNKNLLNLYRHLMLEIGYESSKQDDWNNALYYWQTAQDEGDKSRQLIMNLALAYQHLEDYYEAAEVWRTLLRRRPRKATHPEALNDDQVARIWQNIAENYIKAGFYDDAITTYKNAVKWAPDNINLRLMLVDVFQTEDRWQAAENELNRILNKEPDHVMALIKLAEMYIDDYYLDYAKELLSRALELEPENPIARQQLAHLYLKQGSSISSWGNHNRTIEIYKEGLSLVPDNPKLHVALGGAYAEQHNFDKAHHCFEQAVNINPTDLQTLYTIFLTWLAYDHEPYLGQSLDRIKAAPGLTPSSLFMDLISRCFELEQDKYAKSLLDYVKERYPDDEKALIEVALNYADRDDEKQAVSILRQILKKNPNNTEANLRLGTIYYKIGQTRLANRYWDKAEQQARKEDDQILLYDLKLAKDILIHGKAIPQNPFEILQEMPTELKKQLLEQMPPEIANMLDINPDLLDLMMGFDFMDEFDDDEEDYDDDYF